MTTPASNHESLNDSIIPSPRQREENTVSVVELSRDNDAILSRQLSNEENGTDGLSEPLLLVRERSELDTNCDGREENGGLDSNLGVSRERSEVDTTSNTREQSGGLKSTLLECVRKAMGAVFELVDFVLHGSQGGGRTNDTDDSRISFGTTVLEFFKRCQETLMRRRLERTLNVMMQAHHESSKASTDQARLERQDSLQHLGPMGAALFRPLDTAFDAIDDEALREDTKETSSLLRTTKGEKEELLPEDDRRLNPFGNERLTQSDRGTMYDHPDTGRISPSQDQEAASPQARRAMLLHVPHIQQQTDLTYDPYVSLEETEDSPASLRDYPPVLSTGVMLELIDRGLPPALGLTKSWTRLFSVARDGDDFFTFLQKVHGHKHTVLAIRTTADDIIGGYADSEWGTNHEHKASFYGTGKSFLFKVSRGDPGLVGELGTSPTGVFMDLGEDSPVAEKQLCSNADDTTQVSSATIGSCDSHSETVRFYKWTGKNNYNQFCSPHDGRIAMGGGGDDGSFGLCVQDCFQQGTSGQCETYGNREPLTSTSRFDVVDFEVYGLVNSW